MSEFLKRNWRGFILALSLTFDLFAVLLSSYIASLELLHNGESRYFYLIVATGFLNIFLMLLFGCYRAQQHYAVSRQFILMANAYILTALLSLSFFFVINFDGTLRKTLLIFLFIYPILLFVERSLLLYIFKYLRQRGYGNYPALLVGYDIEGIDIYDRFKAIPELGYDVVGIISANSKNCNKLNGYSTDINFYSLKETESLIKKHSIQRIFVPSQSVIQNGFMDVLSLSQKYRIKIKVLSKESEHVLRFAHVYDISGITLYSSKRDRIDLLKKTIKRSFDIIVALTCISILSPVMIGTAVAIYLESGKPILFRQKRASIKGGKSFYFLKFRSMIKNADQLKEKLYDMNESDGALFKIKDDPRITKVGKFIRKYSIDELPQLFNVLKGDMSIVGPRPIPIGDFEKANESEKFWEAIKERGKFKPGMTGLWQVSGRSNLNFRDMIWLDLYYVENQSLLFDLELLFATIPVVLTGKGSY